MATRIKLLKPADIVIIALAIAAVFFAAMPGKKSGGALSVEVQGPVVAGKRYRASYPLGENRHFSVEGREGEIIVEIEDGSARVVFAPCKNGLCVASPPLRNEGEWTACVPGEVIIRIAGSGTKETAQDLDGIAY